ncbi:hypothetical protein AHF37_08242 [Paragonimus kellicotti]|nr:hypothetical protein AHF37_08242 [Paragonimus kellicotti]
MSKILEFFKTKKLEKKFSRLGEGYRLGEASSCDMTVHRSLPESSSNATTRQPPSEHCESVARAAEAAMERLNQRTKKPEKPVNHEVKRELEELHRAQREAEDLKERFTQKVITTEKPSALSRVLFWCPALFGDAMVGTRDQVEQSINEYLSSEAKVNFPEAATLMLVRGLENHKPPTSPDIPLAEQPTPSEWRAKRRQNFARILNNLIQYPDNPVYRKLRVGNQLVGDLLSIDGAKQFFQASGNAPPMLSRDQLPEEYFYMTKDELKRSVERQQRVIEESGMLLTKAMRERLKVQEIRLFRYALIRVRLPGDLIIQACRFTEQTLEASKPTASSGEPLEACSSPAMEPFLVISEEDAHEVTHLQRMLGLLNSAEPIMPELYRETKVFWASGNAPPMLSRDQLPEEYFYMTKDELKRSVERQQRVIEESGMLLTKAMRERLKVQEIRLFRYALIRVRLPGDLIIQVSMVICDR